MLLVFASRVVYSFGSNDNNLSVPRSLTCYKTRPPLLALSSNVILDFEPRRTVLYHRWLPYMEMVLIVFREAITTYLLRTTVKHGAPHPRTIRGCTETSQPPDRFGNLGDEHPNLQRKTRQDPFYQRLLQDKRDSPEPSAGGAAISVLPRADL